MINQITKPIPYPIVGGNRFGRYSKISTQETFNMMISDGCAVPFAGYQKLLDIGGGGEGRGLFTSTQFNHMIAVVDNGVYSVSTDNSISRLFELATESGDVFIAGNNGNQIGIADGQSIYIYNFFTGLQEAVTGVDFLPSYLDFQDGYFISCGVNTSNPLGPVYNEWRLSLPNNGTNWGTPQTLASMTNVLSSKADTCIAVVNFNKQLYVFGRIVTELWTDVGYTLTGYQRNNYINIDYGCINPASIATGSIQYGEGPNQQLIPLICWLGVNEKSGPAIMYSTGGTPTQLSTDGINYVIEQLRHPENVYGFIYRLAGHTFYQIVWPMDNLSFVYDFNIHEFFTVTDENLNYHIAKRVAFFNNKYYFLSLNDGGLYQTSNSLFTYNYDTSGTNSRPDLNKDIPRIIKPGPVALPNSDPFIANYLDITMQQGDTSTEQVLDISMSVDGGVSYGNTVRHELNLLPNRVNKFRDYDFGETNDFRTQLRFWGMKNFVIKGAELGIYQ